MQALCHVVPFLCVCAFSLRSTASQRDRAAGRQTAEPEWLAKLVVMRAPSMRTAVWRLRAKRTVPWPAWLSAPGSEVKKIE